MANLISISKPLYQSGECIIEKEGDKSLLDSLEKARDAMDNAPMPDRSPDLIDALYEINKHMVGFYYD